MDVKNPYGTRKVIMLKLALVGMMLAACARNVREEIPLHVEGMPNSSVCFSPDESCDMKLVEFIRSAKSTIDIAIFDITHPQIVHEILVASKRIPVRILVDRRQSRGQHSLVSTFVRAGANVRSGRQRGIMHNKFMIVDQEKVETGSFNYTHGASYKNQENQIYFSNKALATRYQERFEKMWKDGRDLRS